MTTSQDSTGMFSKQNQTERNRKLQAWINEFDVPCCDCPKARWSMNRLSNKTDAEDRSDMLEIGCRDQNGHNKDIPDMESEMLCLYCEAYGRFIKREMMACQAREKALEEEAMLEAAMKKEE